MNSRVLTLPYKPLLNFPSVSPTASCPLALSTLDIFLFLKHASLTFIPTFVDLPSSYNTFSRVSLGWFLPVIASTEARGGRLLDLLRKEQNWPLWLEQGKQWKEGRNKDWAEVSGNVGWDLTAFLRTWDFILDQKRSHNGFWAEEWHNLTYI